MLERAQMFEPTLIAEAHAAAAQAPAAGTDPQTLMWLVSGLVSGLVIGLGGLLYHKAPPNPSAPQHKTDPSIEQAQVFFQGPFQAIIDRLNTAVLTLERIVGQNTDLREHFGEIMRTTRHDLKGVLQVMSQEQEHDAEELKRLLHDLSNVVGRLDEFLRARVK